MDKLTKKERIYMNLGKICSTRMGKLGVQIPIYQNHVGQKREKLQKSVVKVFT